MSRIGSFTPSTYEEIKKYCLSCNPSLNLSSQVKMFLNEEVTGVVDKLDNKDPNVTKDEFLELIESYFKTLDFCYGNYDDERLQLVKEDIGTLFSYIDSLELPSSLSHLFVTEMFDRLNEFDDEESRGIYDLLTLDSIKNSKIMKEFLQDPDNHFVSIIKFADNLYKHLDSLNDEEKEKVNYVFRSSYETLLYFISYPNEIETFFNKNILDNFNKESLSMIFRMIRFDEYEDFFNLPEKTLSVIATMNNYVLETTGNNSDFLNCVKRVFHCDRTLYQSIFVDFFDEYHDKYLENGLSVGLEKDDVFNELLSFVLSAESLEFVEKYMIFGLDDLFKARRDYLDGLYMKAFGPLNILKVKFGLLDKDDELVDFDNNHSLSYLKAAFFHRVYGITNSQANYIRKKYGAFLEECEGEFLEEDKATLDMLKTICKVSNLDCYDKEKIKELQMTFYSYIKENGLFKTNRNASFVMVRSLIDKMYMNTYNKVLYNPSLDDVLYYQRGVPVIDSGVEFNMIVNSINGVGEFFRKKDNAKVRHNTTSDSNNQGICTSFINNENLGVISLNGPMLAYTGLDSSTLAAMGISDIYSQTASMSLKNANSSDGEGNFFFTPRQYANYTRYGYNEMVFDRFLYRDEESSLKVQPSYVVAYKMDENYKTTRMYKKSLKMAKEFGIPLVLVDVKKVKEHEREKIIEMEQELFSSKEVNKDLMQAILTRYMNNYSGSITMCRSRDKRGNKWNYKRDFSITGLSKFISKMERKFDALDSKGIEEWYQALNDCYRLEERKNMLANEVASYADSISDGEFVLDDEVLLMDRVGILRDRALNRALMMEDAVDKERVSYNPRMTPIPEIDVVTELSNYLFQDRAFVEMEDSGGKRIYPTKALSKLSEDEKTDYGLIISYMLGTYHDNYFSNLDGCDLSKLRFNRMSLGLKSDLMMSEEFGDKIRTNERLINLARNVSEMSEKDFTRIFKPIVDFEVANYGSSESSVMKCFMKRKQSIISDFSKLPVQEVVTKVDDVKKR